MGFELEYKVNGRKVSKAEWERHLAEEARTVATNELRARVQRLRCRTHGRSPRVLDIHRTGDRFEFKIEACCETMLETAQRTAAGQ